MSDIPPPPPPPPPPQPAYGGAVPPAAPVGPHYATWLSRVGANLLDGLATMVIAIPLLAPGIVVLVVSAQPSAFDTATGAYTGGGPSLLGIGLAALGYLAVFAFAIWNFVVRQGRHGQTLGKKWVHIKVLREANGAVPGVWLALGRYLLQSILTPITLYLNVLWPLWDAKKQALHDKVCKTVVVQVR